MSPIIYGRWDLQPIFITGLSAAGQVQKGGAGLSMVDTGRGRKGPSEGRTPGDDRDLVAGRGRQRGFNARGKSVAG